MRGTKRGRGTAVLAGVLLVSASASAVDVKGSVRTSEDAKQKPIEAVRAPYVLEWNGFIEPKKPSIDLAREVAVVLIGESGMKDAASAKLSDGTLTPSTIVMQAGTNLRIRNEDDFTHQLYAEGLKTFDAVETSAGAGRQVQIDDQGAFPIKDKLAPHVKGTLIVLSKVSAVAHPQNDGTFVFKDVAPGSYTLKVFRAGKEVSSSPLEVESRDFSIDPIAVDKSAK